MARKPRRSREERLAEEAIEQIVRTPGGLQAIVIVAIIGLVIWAGCSVWQRTHSLHQSNSSLADSGSIRIATWNLRKFGERDKAGEHPPDLVTIADIIKTSNFDLLAIQEVQQEGQEVQKLRRQLNEPWRHIISDRTGNHERFAFLYRSDRVELIDSPHFMPSPDAQIFDRVPFIASFRAGQFDFTLVTAHLSYTDTARRRREAEALARFAKDLAAHAAEKDVIVLGDFNEQHQHGNLHFFEEQGWMRLNNEPSNLGSTEIYDNFLIDRQFTREWTGRAGVIRFDEMRFANNDHLAVEEVSDHRPAWAEFATAGPDDD